MISFSFTDQIIQLYYITDSITVSIETETPCHKNEGGILAILHSDIYWQKDIA